MKQSRLLFKQHINGKLWSVKAEQLKKGIFGLCSYGEWVIRLDTKQNIHEL